MARTQMWDGSQWLDMSGGGDAHIVSETAPVDPKINTVWVDPSAPAEGTYLPLTGGTLTGDLVMTLDTKIKWDSDAINYITVQTVAPNNMLWVHGGIIRQAFVDTGTWFRSPDNTTKLELENSSVKIDPPLNIDGTQIADAHINAYTDSQWSIRMRNASATGGGFAITKLSNNSEFRIYDYEHAINLLTFQMWAGDPTWGYLITPSVYNSTNTAGANVYVDSSGRMLRSTSSLGTKTDIRDVGFGESLEVIRKLQPIEFRSAFVEDDQIDRLQIGFGAEPTVEADERLGADDNYDIRGVVAHLVNVVKELVKDG